MFNIFKDIVKCFYSHTESLLVVMISWHGLSYLLLKAVSFLALHKKWGFALWISSVNETKSADSCGFGHIYWRNL